MHKGIRHLIKLYWLLDFKTPWNPSQYRGLHIWIWKIIPTPSLPLPPKLCQSEALRGAKADTSTSSGQLRHLDLEDERREAWVPPPAPPSLVPPFYSFGVAILTFCRGAPWGRTGVSRDRKTLWLICLFWSWRKRTRRRRTCCCPRTGARQRHRSRPLRCCHGSCAGAWTWCRRPRVPATRRACWTSCVFSLDCKGQRSDRSDSDDS